MTEHPIGMRVVDVLWPEGESFVTGWGTKRREGLAACIEDLTAAPELLNQLRWMIFQFERVDSSDGAEQEEALSDGRLQVKLARAAIAKAEGRTA